MHARYFSAHLGRFHSFDPVGGTEYNPQSWNRYAYVLGNPMKYTDPRGLIPGVLQPFDEFAGAFLASMNFITVTGKPFAFSPGSASFPVRRFSNLNSMGLYGLNTGGSDPFALNSYERLLSSLSSDFAQVTGEAVVGFGDMVSFTLTDLYRTEAGLANTINEDSGAYLTGQVAGVAHGIAFGGLGTARLAGVQSRVALHGAHHTFGRFGRLYHFQINIWRIGVKGSGRAFRFPLPWR